jgi:hypothetical protein
VIEERWFNRDQELTFYDALPGWPKLNKEFVDASKSGGGDGHQTVASDTGYLMNPSAPISEKVNE